MRTRFNFSHTCESPNSASDVPCPLEWPVVPLIQSCAIIERETLQRNRSTKVLPTNLDNTVNGLLRDPDFAIRALDGRHVDNLPLEGHASRREDLLHGGGDFRPDSVTRDQSYRPWL